MQDNDKPPPMPTTCANPFPPRYKMPVGVGQTQACEIPPRQTLRIFLKSLAMTLRKDYGLAAQCQQVGRAQAPPPEGSLLVPVELRYGPEGVVLFAFSPQAAQALPRSDRQAAAPPRSPPHPTQPALKLARRVCRRAGRQLFDLGGCPLILLPGRPHGAAQLQTLELPCLMVSVLAGEAGLLQMYFDLRAAGG